MNFSKRSFGVLLFNLTFWAAGSVYADSRVFVLSGGNDPAYNHYSQYLQTRLLAQEMKSTMGAANVSVMFGGGNNEATPRLLADVNRQINQGSDSFLQMDFGVIPENVSATKANVLNYFSSPEVARLGPQDTFFMFVSDHGMPNQDGGYNDNCINLWRFEFNAEGFSFRPFSDACLSRSELQTTLQTKVHAGHKIFAMSQCYSGGFHQMSVQSDHGYPTADPQVCGFTAVSEDTTASGCTPNVDGPNYQGFERYFTQQLTGKDVVTGATLPEGPKSSPREAHLAAARQDSTKDIPLATSDYYLLQWAKAFEREDFQPRSGALTAQAIRKYYNDLLNNPQALHDLAGMGGELGGWFRERSDYLTEVKALVTQADAKIAAMIKAGDARAIETEAERERTVSDRSSAQAAQLDEQSAVLRFKSIFPAWERQVQNGKAASYMTPLDFTLEKKTALGWEKSFAGVYNVASRLSQVSQRAAAIKKASNPAGADEFMRFVDRREQDVRVWLSQMTDPALQRAAAQMYDLETRSSQLWEISSTLIERRDRLRRVLFAQKVLAAAATLQFMKDQQGLTDLMGLLSCESTPLR